jgi:predicted TIM-barrel fold metal-dependent hydrolase
MSGPGPDAPGGERRPIEILDAHQHYGTVLDSLGGSTGVTLSRDEIERRELEHRLEVLDRRRVTATVIIAGHSYLRPDGLADTRRVNDDLLAYAARAPERFIATVGVVEPLYGAAGLSEIDRCAAAGMAGISFHGRFQGVSHDSRWVWRYIERMGERGLLPFMHAPADSPEEALWKTAGLAADFPDLTMLVLDAFSDFEQAREAVAVGERGANLFFDTALCYDFQFVKPFVERCGAHRVVYGSDLYSWPTGDYGEDSIRQILDAGLDEEATRQILGTNLRQLLGR